MIPLDFVAGTHGHFVEYVLNRSFGFCTQDFDPFTVQGTSHQRPKSYIDSRQIVCGHWFENRPHTISQANHVIRIVFAKDDALWVTALSLARSGDLRINDDQLHIQTKSKLSNFYYRSMLDKIYDAYDCLNPNDESIPRNVLREFFKFGFRDPAVNGYWCKLQDMLSVPVKNQYQIQFRDIYDLEKFCQNINNIADWLKLPCDIQQWLEPLHRKFLSYLDNPTLKDQCDEIVACVVEQQHIDIPKLTLLQESYMNGRLEKIYQKEMPFHDINYFTNTKDIIQYIKYQAPDI